VIEATLAAQDRALAFAKDVYSQSDAAGSEGRELFEKLFAASREISEATVELSRNWTQDSSWADAWRTGFEAMTSAAQNGSTSAPSGKAKAPTS
jgi:hypothetical protein